jgi:glycerol-3-phosphate cytidylyltransferase-like family protein
VFFSKLFKEPVSLSKMRFHNNSPYVKKVLEQCDKQYLVKIYIEHELFERGIIITTRVQSDGEKNLILMSNPDMYVSRMIYSVMNIKYLTEENIQLITVMYNILNDLLSVAESNMDAAIFKNDENPKKIYIPEEAIMNMQSLLFELEALKKGIQLERSSESSERSYSRSSQRERSPKMNKSLSEKPGLPALPKKTRAEILKELEMTCTDMRDTISQQEFRDMRKKKLQLIVHIGPKSADNKQNCYYVKNIFDYVKNELSNKRVPTDPNTRVPMTEELMNTIILPKMKYIKLNVVDPYKLAREPERRFPNIQLIVGDTEDHTGRPYYTVGYTRKIGSIIDNSSMNIGTIPANIYVRKEDRDLGEQHRTDVFTGDSSLSSGTIITALKQLYDKGRFTDNYGNPKVEIDYDFSYWTKNVKHKARLMLDEINYHLQ